MPRWIALLKQLSATYSAVSSVSSSPRPSVQVLQDVPVYEAVLSSRKHICAIGDVIDSPDLALGQATNGLHTWAIAVMDCHHRWLISNWQLLGRWISSGTLGRPSALPFRVTARVLSGG